MDSTSEIKAGCCGTRAILEIVAGPLTGTRVALSETRETIIGRDGSCTVVLPSGSISRRHARLIADESTFVVEDLESVNGTYVNSRRVDERVRLQHGDRINIYDVPFVFHVLDSLEQAGEYASEVELTFPLPPSEVQSSSETVILGPDTDPEFLAIRDGAKLHVIAEITRRLGTTLDIDQVLPNVLDLLFEAFPHLVNGQILLLDALGQLIPKALKQGREDDSAVFAMGAVDNAAAQQVIKTGEINLVRGDISESALDEGARSLLTAPIVGPAEDALGVIHLESVGDEAIFAEADVEFVVSVAAVTGQVVEHVNTHHALLQAECRRQQLAMARQVQLKMLPRERPSVPGYNVSDHYSSASEVGGDFYGYFPLKDGVVIAIGDVCGKGFPAALTMAQVVLEVRHCVTETHSLKRAMRHINRAAYLEKFGFVTFLLCVLSPRHHTLTVCNAGHLPPFLRRQRSQQVEALQPMRSGFPLGIYADQEFHPSTFSLEAGDSVLMYTDGLTESMSPEGGVFGIDRVGQQVQKNSAGPETLIQSIISEVGRFRAGVSQNDDLCLIAVNRTEANEPLETESVEHDC